MKFGVFNRYANLQIGRIPFLQHFRQYIRLSLEFGQALRIFEIVSIYRGPKRTSATPVTTTKYRPTDYYFVYPYPAKKCWANVTTHYRPTDLDLEVGT